MRLFATDYLPASSTKLVSLSNEDTEPQTARIRNYRGWKLQRVMNRLPPDNGSLELKTLYARYVRFASNKLANRRERHMRIQQEKQP